MFNNNTPLWLPEGSVRSILAFALTGAAIVASFVEGSAPDQYLWPAALVVNGFYFADRSNKSDN